MLLAAFVCEAEEPSTFEVAVRVDPVVESTAFPAQVLVAFDSSGAGLLFFRVGFLCTPEAPFSTTITFGAASGGDAPSSVDAFIVPVEPGAPVRCGDLAAPEPVSFPGAPPPPRATAGFTAVGGCGIGEVRTAAIVM